MIPRTFPSTYASNGQQQMVVYFLTSIAGLQRWADYIPVRLAQGGVENSYANNGYIDVTVVSSPTATQQAWKEYIPVYLDDSATDAWLVNAVGYIPYGYALFSGASLMLDMTNGGRLDPRITFSRTTNATLTDSTGTLVYAPHNLLTFSEQIDDNAWTKTDVTVAANNSTAPDGTTTADRLTEGSAGTSILTRAASAAVQGGATITGSFYAKRSSVVQWVRFRLSNSAASNGCNVWFDIQNGVLGSTSTIGSATGSSGAIAAVGDGWYRLSVTTTLTSSDTTALVALISASADASTTRTSGSVYWVWGAQLNVSTLQPYNPTTVKNLLGFTQEFNNAAWVKNLMTVTANADIAPDGSMTADLIDTATETVAVYPSQTAAVVNNGIYVLSVYVKAGTAGFLRFRTGLASGSSSIWYSISAGTFAAAGAGWSAGSSIDVGNGWRRVSAQIAYGAADGGARGISIVPTGSFGGTTPTGTVFLWGAQLSDSASLDPYVYNPAAAFTSTAYYGPRFDYDPVTLAARGLLIEEQRTNSHLQSESVNLWGTPTAASVSADVAVAPTGVQSADKLVENTATAAHFLSSTSLSFSYTLGTVYTRSCYLKADGRHIVSLFFPATNFPSAGRTAVFELLNGTVYSAESGVTAQIQSVGAGWYRCAITVTCTVTGSGHSGGSALYDASGNTSYAGDGTSGALIWGAQLEAGAFATSYIPTTTAAATRAADICTMVGDNFANWYNQSEGTLFADAVTPPNLSAFPTVLTLSDGSTNNQISHYLFTNGYYANVRSGGVVQGDVSRLTAPTTGANYKYAVGVKLDDAIAAANGLIGVVDSSLLMPVGINQMRLGAGATGGAVGNTHIRRISYFPRRVSNAELQALTV
jgi:hypothetical protein